MESHDRLTAMHQLEELIRAPGWRRVQAELQTRIATATTRLTEGDPRDVVAMAKTQAERKALTEITELPLTLRAALQAELEGEG